MQVDTGDVERDTEGYFYCRARCGNVFSNKSTRNRHERLQHSGFQQDDTSEETSKMKKPEDYLYNYHRGKLAFGLLLFEFEDAIKEADGDRLQNVYKFSLLIYKRYGHHKYAYVTLLNLVNIQAALTEFQANSLKWNRFYNKYGGEGRNIPLDLRMEQLNKQLKSLWRALGANIDESNASRVANAIEGLAAILESVDKDCSLSVRKGHRSKGKPEDTVKQIINDLMMKSVFKYTPHREGHCSFPKFNPNLIAGIDYRDVHKWMTDTVTKWTSIIEKSDIKL